MFIQTVPNDVVGAADLLVHVAPLLASAARAERTRREGLPPSRPNLNEELRNFEHDLVLIQKQLIQFFQIGRLTLTLELDDFLHQTYGLGLVDDLIDRAELSRHVNACEDGMLDDIRFHPRIDHLSNLKELYRLEMARAFGGSYVSFAQVDDARVLTQRLRTISGANGELHSELSRLISENPLRIQRTPAHNAQVSRDGAHGGKPEASNSHLAEQQIQTPSKSRKRLAAINKALHATWPDHRDCAAENHSKDTLWGRWADCSSARLRLDRTWKGSMEDTKQYDMLLHAADDTFRQFRVAVLDDTEHISPSTHSPICRSQRHPSLDHKICLLLDRKGMLWDHRDVFQAEEAEDWDDLEEWTLKVFVPHTELIYKEKLILMFNLATSLRHLLGTNWLPADWGMDDVSVFYHKKTRKLNLHTAYIKADLRADRPSAGPDHLHRQPRILMLGILMMELLLGQRGPSYSSAPKAGSLNAPLKRAQQLLKECEKRFPMALLGPIRQCIDIHAYTGENSVDEISSDACKNYYVQVVHVLEQILSQEEVDTRNTPRASSEDGASALIDENFTVTERERRRANYTRRNSSHTTLQASQDSASASQYYAMASFGKALVERNTNWSEQLKHLARRSARGRTASLGTVGFENLVRVAIIDTGCNPHHEGISPWLAGWSSRCNGLPGYQYRRGGIWGWKDFVDGESGDSRPQDAMHDSSADGHGTFMTYLLLNTMPWLQVFVARVFAGSDTTDTSTPDRVRKAVQHAVDEWKVDIISMSFHLLLDPDDQVKRCIEAASNTSNVIFFVAAGNNLHAENRSIGFPATMPEVFCINSHNDNSKASDFTPNAVGHRPNFCAIGESLRGPDSTAGNTSWKYMSGTSCATPIAAAYAAMALDVVKSEGGGPQARARLKNVKAMKHIFWSRMTEMGKQLGKHNVVKPGLLFQPRREGWTDADVLRELDRGTQEDYTFLH